MIRLLRIAAALSLCAAIFPGASASTAQPLEAGKGLIIFHVLQRCYEGHVQFGRYAAEQKTWKLAGWSFTRRSVADDDKVSGTPTQKPLEPGHYGIFEFDCNLRTPIIMGGRPLAVFDVQAGRVNNLGAFRVFVAREPGLVTRGVQDIEVKPMAKDVLDKFKTTYPDRGRLVVNSPLRRLPPVLN